MIRRTIYFICRHGFERTFSLVDLAWLAAIAYTAEWLHPRIGLPMTVAAWLAAIVFCAFICRALEAIFLRAFAIEVQLDLINRINKTLAKP